MKTCTACSTKKDEDEFAWKIKSKGIRVHLCHPCRRLAGKSAYQRNRKQTISRTVERHKGLREQYREYKTTLKCERCSENHSACLQFHHPDKNKEFNVSSMTSYGWKAMLREMNKCIVLCANCHAKEHSG